MTDAQVETDFLIIGGGTIGLPVAVWLAEKTNKQVTCLEAGTNNVVENLLGTVDIVGDRYDGTQEGRKFGLGGTSTVWGGALVPFLDNDCIDANWPLNTSDLKQYFVDIEELFNLPPNYWPFISSNYSSSDDSQNYCLRSALWPSFKNRNVYNLLKKKIKRLKNLKLLDNSTVISITNHNNESVVVIKGEPSKSIVCKQVIVCAGAIESTRLALLCSDNASIGKNFCDHLSAPIGDILPRSRPRFNKKFAFKFLPNGTMISKRFEMHNAASLRKNVPPHHFYFAAADEKDRDSHAFNHLRTSMRRMQRGQLPRIKNMIGLLKNLPWLFNFIYWRLVNKTLLWPTHSSIKVHLVMQQDRDCQNTITLSDEAPSSYDPKPLIQWRIRSSDLSNIAAAVEQFEAFWDEQYAVEYGPLQSDKLATITGNFKTCGGIYHPTSTLSFGSGDDCPLDDNLYLKGSQSLQFISTACLPTGGGVNPTMMALLLAARCVDQHVNAL